MGDRVIWVVYFFLCIISLGYKDEERKPYDLSKLQYEKVDFVG